MRAIQDQADEWINTRAVQGLAVGTRSRDGRPTDELVIVVYVDRKRPPRRRCANRVPRRIVIPGLGTFETDVVAIGELAPLEFPDHVRPAMPGCSIGHVDLDGYGTFGLLVKKQAGQGSGLFILSNSHVLALDGLAAVGDDIVQPGPADIDGESGTIAKLADWVPFDFTTTGWPNLVDAAIARVLRSNNVTNSIREINVVPVATSFEITEGMRVRKVGRSSDDMSGEVINPSANLKHKHMKTSTTRGYVRYADQVWCDRFAGPGDSGSIVLNDQNEVVGLVCCGVSIGVLRSTRSSTFSRRWISRWLSIVASGARWTIRQSCRGERQALTMSRSRSAVELSVAKKPSR